MLASHQAVSPELCIPCAQSYGHCNWSWDQFWDTCKTCKDVCPLRGRSANNSFNKQECIYSPHISKMAEFPDMGDLG